MISRVLALDLSTNTGWALRRADGAVFSGVKQVGRKECTDGYFFHDFDLWLSDLITVETPDVLIFEAPILRGGKTSIQTARRLIGLATVCDLIGHRREIRIVRECDLQTVKLHFAKHGHATKPQMIAAARALGFDPVDDNEADALGVLSYACHVLKLPSPMVGNFAAVNAARSVA